MADEQVTQPGTEGQTTESKSEGEKKSIAERINERHESHIPPPSTEKKVEEQPNLVTEEMVKEIPALKGLVGKPVSELVKSYASLNSEYGRSQQELGELKKAKPEAKPETKPEAKEVKQEKSLQEQIDELVDKTELPDPLDDPKGFAKANAKLQMKINELMNKPQEQERQERERQQKVQAEIQKTADLLTKELPEGVKLEDVQNGFASSIAEFIKAEPTYYFGKPELLASDIARWYWKDQASKGKDGGPRPEVKGAIDSMKKKIESAPSSQARSESVKGTEVELTAAEKLAKRIQERNEKTFPTPSTKG